MGPSVYGRLYTDVMFRDIRDKFLRKVNGFSMYRSEVDRIAKTDKKKKKSDDDGEDTVQEVKSTNEIDWLDLKNFLDKGGRIKDLINKKLFETIKSEFIKRLDGETTVNHDKVIRMEEFQQMLADTAFRTMVQSRLASFKKQNNKLASYYGL